jgi:transposase
MVYGGISSRGKISLIFVTGTTGLKKSYVKQQGGTYRGVSADGYTTMILTKVIPQAEKMFSHARWHLLQDGAPAHRAGSTKKAFARAQVRLVEKWPGNSPDSNPIANVWSWMVRWISKHAHCITVDELKQAVLQAWKALPMTVIKSNINSMQERLRICIQRNGDHTGY